MPSLKLKIPPPLILIICGLAMWLLPVSIPVDNKPGLRLYFVAASVIIGMVFAVSGIFSFKKAETTVNPTTPEKSSSLVNTGIYQFTRNPMYLGLLFVLIGWAVFLYNFYCAFIVVGFVLYMNKFQIKPEEEALASLFGNEYISYMKSVRRWI